MKTDGLSFGEFEQIVRGWLDAEPLGYRDLFRMLNEAERNKKQPLTTAEHTEAHSDKVAGYSRLTDEQIEMINKIKAKGMELDGLLSEVYDSGLGDQDQQVAWITEADLTLRKGIMFLVRSVAQPDGF